MTIEGDEIRDWGTKNILYRVSGGVARNMSGQIVFDVSNDYLRDRVTKNILYSIG